MPIQQLFLSEISDYIIMVQTDITKFMCPHRVHKKMRTCHIGPYFLGIFIAAKFQLKRNPQFYELQTFSIQLISFELFTH